MGGPQPAPATRWDRRLCPAATPGKWPSVTRVSRVLRWVCVPWIRIRSATHGSRLGDAFW
jgi:hypothetical protein